MEVQGMLLGLSHRYGRPVEYQLDLGCNTIELNPYIGSNIKFIFTGEIRCIACGRKIRKTYNNGYCYPCFVNLPENDLCIVKPHQCHYHQGTCRDAGFGERHCMIPHYVYLALSSDVKVGLTRKHNEIKRWIDQGAVKALPIAEVPTRKSAGELEHFLSQTMPDKTNWRKMLKGEVAEIDLLELRDEVHRRFPEEFEPCKLRVDEITEILYPVTGAVNVKPLHLEKEGEIIGKLIGIKGQYLLFEEGVLNMKKYAGYHVRVCLESETAS